MTMDLKRFIRPLKRLLLGRPRRGPRVRRTHRSAVTHVIILDGTMSTLTEGCETNAGLTYKLLSEVVGSGLSIYYEAGVQWPDWKRTADMILGRGINRQIKRAYGYLASRYRQGDRIFLIGFSRGAYAVRSLAGVIDQVGLLKPQYATERHIETAYRHYRDEPGREVAEAFTARRCHPEVEIEMIGVWDTVKALGLGLPILWRFSTPKHAFHNHELGPVIRHGYHALALHETRKAYTPVLWNTQTDAPGAKGRVEQVWFRGSHGDVGGQLDGFHAARHLSNIPLVWMLERAGNHGLDLPQGWRDRFVCDASAPSVGTWRGWARIFLMRAPRKMGQDPSERVHESVEAATKEEVTGAEPAV